MWRSAVPEVVSSRVIYYHAIHVISSMEFRRGGGSGPIRAVSQKEANSKVVYADGMLL